MVNNVLKAAFKKNIFTRIAALAAMPVLKAVRHTLDPKQYNGASLLGLNGIVIKSHGGADTDAYLNAIKIAIIEIDKSIPDRINKEIEQYLQNDEEKTV